MHNRNKLEKICRSVAKFVAILQPFAPVFYGQKEVSLCYNKKAALTGGFKK